MNYKKITSAFLAVVMTVQLSAPVYAETAVPVYDSGFEPIFAIELSEEEFTEAVETIEEDYSNVEIVSNDKYAAYDHTTDYFYNQLDTEEKALYDGIVDACEAFASSSVNLTPNGNGYGYIDYVYFDGTSITESEMYQIFFAVYYSNPQFYFLANGYSFSGMGTSNAAIIPVANGEGDNFCLYSTRSKYSAKINAVTEQWMTQINALDNDLEKETWIAEKLCDYITYTYSDFDQSLAGALVDQECVCNGYAMAMTYFCNAAGIECISVVSEEHAWNRVKLYGNWYEVDTTWMDQETHIWYDWFNKSEATFTSEEAQGMHDIDPTNYEGEFTLPACTLDEVKVFDRAKAVRFVERLYTQLLGRASDNTGRLKWVEKLQNGATAADVAVNFVLSPELKQQKLSNKTFVKRMYNTMLNRTPSDSEVENWASYLEAGCTYAFVFRGFLAAPEFSKLCTSYGIETGTYTATENRDVNGKLTKFISRLYTKALNRAYDVSGLNHHTGNYISGKYTLDKIASGFIFSAEFEKRNLSDADFVECMYNTFFNRASDANGKASWLKKMVNGMSREDVFNGFVSSPEYKALVKSFGL
ncbi:MAG: DUF4214 domain-containing protein [Ruminiclostridium sp.]|nr:DUF4214 domain-containing protein [Ruminiclostridium sp.]MBQ8825767.1 DUF4214 domain-containing protein [Oscillospiraceae bacterium]